MQDLLTLPESPQCKRKPITNTLVTEILPNRKGSPSTILWVTYQQPLWIWKKPNLQLRLARYSLHLEPYALILQYRQRKTNPTDYKSRHPINTTKQSSRNRKSHQKRRQTHRDTLNTTENTLETPESKAGTPRHSEHTTTLWSHVKTRRAHRDILDKPENIMDTPEKKADRPRHFGPTIKYSAHTQNTLYRLENTLDTLEKEAETPENKPDTQWHSRQTKNKVNTPRHSIKERGHTVTLSTHQKTKRTTVTL